MRAARFLTWSMTLALGLAILFVATFATADAAPMRVTIVPLAAAGDVQRYRLDVLANGDPVAVDVPADASEADLIVDGTLVRRVGRNVPFGHGGLGHATTLLELDGLDATNRIELRVMRSRGAPEIVRALPAQRAFRNGYIGGVYVAILSIVALFNLVTFVGTRDRATAWYVAFLSLVIAAHLMREGFIFPGSPNAGALTVGIAAGSLVALGGFALSFLQIWTRSRRATWLAAIGIGAPMALMAAYVGIAHAAITDLTIAVPLLVAVVSIVAVTIWRRIDGFRPATFLILGILGLIAGLVAKIYRETVGLPSEFLDRFGFEISMAFDVIVCSAGIVYRSQYGNRKFARIASELAGVTFEAHHDPLTQLLNRRGFDAYARTGPGDDGTVLFIDIDGFKRINDLGGHAAGDAALVEIARAISHTVRHDDIVARVGGDEFVVVLPGIASDGEPIAEIVDRARAAIAALYPLEDRRTRIDASIGRCGFGAQMGLFEALEAADRDAYRVKRGRLASRDDGRRIVER